MTLSPKPEILEGQTAKAVDPATPLFGPSVTLPDSSGWWWYRHASDLDPVCVEVTLYEREDGTLRGGDVCYGRQYIPLMAWQNRAAGPEWVKAIVPWPNR